MSKQVGFRLPPDRQEALEEVASWNGLDAGSAASLIVQAWLDGRQAPLRKLPKEAPRTAASQAPTPMR